MSLEHLWQQDLAFPWCTHTRDQAVPFTPREVYAVQPESALSRRRTEVLTRGHGNCDVSWRGLIANEAMIPYAPTNPSSPSYYASGRRSEMSRRDSCRARYGNKRSVMVMLGHNKCFEARRSAIHSQIDHHPILTRRCCQRERCALLQARLIITMNPDTLSNASP